jgi:class 3 adenylate cyclase/predicted ATPase
MFCSQCGSACPDAARFCSQCGARLMEAAPAQAPPAAAPAPAAARDARPSGAVERRHMTFVFCDLVGSTELSQQLDPEDLRDIVSDYREACGAAVARYEGTVAQYYGDGILIYFGYPIAHEDDARRAVQAALEVLDGVRALNQRLKSEGTAPVAVRIGVHTGLAVVGDVGGANRTERLAMGDTPNIAARIQGLAQPGSVVISAATHRLVAEFFRTEALGPQVLKGVADPMDAYAVGGASSAHSRLEAAASQRLTAYVGRESILGPLTGFWRDAVRGRGRLVILTGDAGIGKSRLVHVFRDLLSDERHHSSDCFCSPYHASSALYPITEMLRARLRLSEEHDPRLQLERVRAGLAEYRGDPDSALALLAHQLGIPPEAGYTPLALHPLTQKQRTLELLEAMLVAPAERRPALLVIEDLHWVDPTTLELLGGLTERLGSQRLLVVATARPAFRPPWPQDDTVRILSVTDLSPADTEAMVQSLTGGKPLPPAVLAMLVKKSDGNPLFVEEMTRMLIESGWLADAGGRYELSGPMPDGTVPTRLQDLLRARLDRMEPEARTVVQLGSVVGREFDYHLLLEMLPNEEAVLRRGLQLLLHGGLVYPDGSHFVIKHELIKDVAYDSLLKRTRQQYHERIALAYEGPFAADAQGHPERLAQHWTRAGQPVRAIPYWLQAGQKAVASSAVEEAAAHLRQGLDLIAGLPESADRDRLELDLLSTLGTALTIQKGWAAPEVADAYSRAEALSDRVGDSPTLFWVLWGLWAFYLVKGDQMQGLALAERMMRFAETSGNDGWVLEADFSLGLSHYYLGRLEVARTHLERAVAAYVPEKHHANCFLSCQDVGVTSRSVASMVLYLLGETDLALERSADALRLAAELHHPFSQAYALGCAAWFNCYRRDFDAMAARAADTMALSQAQALGWWLLWGMVFAGRGLTHAGDAAAGIKQMDEALGMYRGVGTGMVVPFFLTQFAEAHLVAGQYDRALERLADARQLIAQGHEAFPEPEVDRLEGQIRAHQIEAAGGAPDAECQAVEALYRRALDTARAQGARLFELRAATSLARALAGRGDTAGACAVLDQSFAHLPDVLTASRDLLDARALRLTLASS